MDVGLPKETQQIDRVMEAFATRYLTCNPGLFVSNGVFFLIFQAAMHLVFMLTNCIDHPYILAFSLIMLHTDAFNKSNKRKMTKADYIRNTKLVGVPTEVLDVRTIRSINDSRLLILDSQCFYDNTVFAPFIFIEDPLDINGQRGFTQDAKTLTPTSGQMPPNANGGLSLLGKANKVDPYFLITRVST